MSEKVSKHLGDAGSLISGGGKRSLRSVLQSICDDLAGVKAKFNAHKHGFDGTSAATSRITNTPVTGTTSGTALAGTASAVVIGTTRET
jgi:hypothetical protein